MIRTQVICDVCTKVMLTLTADQDLKQVLSVGAWAETEYGHACSYCAQGISEAEALGESASFEPAQIVKVVREDATIVANDPIIGIRPIGTLSANDVAVVVKDILKDE